MFHQTKEHVNSTKLLMLESSKQDDKNDVVFFDCATCNKPCQEIRWKYNMRLKQAHRGVLYCSPVCALVGRPVSDESKAIRSNAQKNISVPSRGRKGHVVTAETRAKISASKRGVVHKKNYDYVGKEVALLGFDRVINTELLVPDAIAIDGNKVIAIEVEKDRWEADLRYTMTKYNRNPNHGYDKVIAIWCTPDNIRRKVWTWEHGEWSLTWQAQQQVAENE